MVNRGGDRVRYLVRGTDNGNPSAIFIFFFIVLHRRAVAVAEPSSVHNNDKVIYAILCWSVDRLVSEYPRWPGGHCPASPVRFSARRINRNDCHFIHVFFLMNIYWEKEKTTHRIIGIVHLFSFVNMYSWMWLSKGILNMNITAINFIEKRSSFKFGSVSVCGSFTTCGYFIYV